MSIAFYSPTHQTCERCESTIYIGHEFLLDKDGLFCGWECFIEHLKEHSEVKQMHLVDDEFYKGMD